MVSLASGAELVCLHAGWVGGRLCLWAESADRPGPADAPWLTDAQGLAHEGAASPSGGGAVALGSALAAGRRVEIRLRLPAEGGVALVSPGLALASGVGWEGHGEGERSLVQVTAGALSFEPDAVCGVLDALADAAGDEGRVVIRGGDRVREMLLADSVRAYEAALGFARQLVIQQRFVPSLSQHPDGRLLGQWQPWLADEPSADRTSALLAAMPAAAFAGVDEFEHDRWRVLSDFLAAMVDAEVRAGLRGASLETAIADRRDEDDAHVAWLAGLLGSARESGVRPADRTATARGVRRWLSRLEERGASAQWRLCLRLHEPEDAGGLDDLRAPGDGVRWPLTFHLRAVDAAEVEVDAAEVWSLTGQGITIEGRRLDEPHQLLLGELGRAARLYDRLESALRESEPTRVELTTRQAYQFLRDAKPVLAEQGVVVEAPAWWDSPTVRVGATLRLDSDPLESIDLDAGGGAGSSHTAQPQLGLQTLVRYSWEISLGGLKLTLSEFEQLAKAGAPLVRVGGQWAEVRAEDVRAASRFIREHPGGEMTVLEAIRMAHGSFDDEQDLPIVGIETSGWLGAVFGSSEQAERLPEVRTPPTFRGELRPYQLRGLSWMAFLEQFGFGACLADDMGLGKTIQVLALLARERHLHAERGNAAVAIPPTLAVVPMSVLGNWEHEARRFCPTLRVLVHHGAERLSGQAFLDRAGQSDVVLTTYALANRDRELLSRMAWRRLVLDEAQCIKNPQAKQAQAVRQLEADHRLALTGTPVENKLTELWSIIDYTNPGYLGSIGAFRRRFSLPIERYRDTGRREQLRRLVRPFILRRLKTDQAIAGDLPEKVESREYCHLTTEQAQLYETAVNRMLRDIDQVEGMHRRGMVLSTLIRLKQICNHPAQLLKDHDFARPGAPDTGRSGKCERLVEMLDEVLESGEQALIFTQFRQMGRLLVPLLQHELGQEALFLHGGVTQARRQGLVERFQAGEAPLLILSLKAGGVGLNLTAATHVFHFDRWWNPAVENQATDRAFRIGQTRRVQVHKFVVRGTLEERIDAMIEQKTELAEQIVGAGERWLTELDSSSLRDLLTLRSDAVGESAGEEHDAA